MKNVLILKNESLNKYNSWRVGGTADALFSPKNLEDLKYFLKHESYLKPLTFIGLGSNILVRDGGIRGTVIVMHAALNEIQMTDQGVYSEAGNTCAKIAKILAKEHYVEGEFFAGIPGTVGGALAMNAGCYGSETWNFVTKVNMIDEGGNIVTRLKDEFKISYREVIKPNLKEWFVGAWFNFKKDMAADPESKIKEYLNHRKNTQPLNWPTAGSTFRNPKDTFAAKLIEDCGLKGFRVGNAEVSDKHANFIINLGDASAKDIENIIDYVESEVFKRKGIKLEREVKILGDFLS
ncbi:MurB UDP-N-acetylmuramate dehydrogenase [Candidatus Methylopumilus universalis]|uniref:UDP-N-acetylmuramate dehydrogenase n=1 Tax=Candidatus Methylopumilus universalis TaxID=2588536 RepID=UPI003BEEBD00